MYIYNYIYNHMRVPIYIYIAIIRMGIIWGSKDPKWCPQIDCRTSQCLTLDTPRWHLTYLQTVGKEVEKLKVVFWVQDRKIWKKTIRPTPGFPWSFQECPSGAPPLSRPGQPQVLPFRRSKTLSWLTLGTPKLHGKPPRKRGGTWGLPQVSLVSPGSFVQTI